MCIDFAKWYNIKKVSAINCFDVSDIFSEIKNFEGYARVDSIYDGDSPSLVFWYSPLKRYIRMRMRMAHYDTAEIKGSTTIEKEIAIDSRNFFIELVNFKAGSDRKTKKNPFSSQSDIVYFKVVGMDNQWSRPVIMLWNVNSPQHSINYLIHSHYGINYEGGKKDFKWGESRDGKITLDYDYPFKS